MTLRTDKRQFDLRLAAGLNDATPEGCTVPVPWGFLLDLADLYRGGGGLPAGHDARMWLSQWRTRDDRTDETMIRIEGRLLRAACRAVRQQQRRTPAAA